jgi:lysophospholipase L1-like esterase
MRSASIALVLLTFGLPARGQEKMLPQDWDYAGAMKKVAAGFAGKPGVVLHLGDSITYSNPYSQWARGGAGQSAEDKALLKWMHTGAKNDSDGWHLASFDHPAGGRSYTACSGIRSEEMLAGGKQKMPPLKDILTTYKPQIVVLMLGTNDASARRKVDAFRADMEKAVDLILAQNAICILSTIPPHPGQLELAKSYNEALRKIAKDKSLPLIDYEKEILKRRPDDWNGTLLQKNDVHPTANQGGANAAAAPTAENLRNSGYLLRGWLSVQKIGEVKKKVIDGLPEKKEKEEETRQPKQPKGTPIRLAVTRDTWLSQVGPEGDGSNGASPRLKVKSNQEMSLIDFNFNQPELRGKVIEAAILHVHSAGGPPLRRITVSSVAAPWFEGTATSYAKQDGASTFRRRKHPNEFWTVPGSDLCSVILGQGGTIWRMADASPPDANGWQKIAIDPAVVAARVAGISNGFLLFDDTGTEWKRDGEKYESFHFPNRFIHSRESGAANAPYLMVYVGPEDREPPPAPTGLASEAGDLPAGEAWVSWITPKDEGPAGTIGFMVSAAWNDVPRYLIPAAGKPGSKVRMHLRDMDLAPGVEIPLQVRALDGVGNIGPAASVRIRTSTRKPAPLPGSNPAPFPEVGPLPKLGGAEVAVIDELDKVHPVSGVMIPTQPDGYLAANHLWSARGRQIRLHAARNEFVSFQILLNGAAADVVPTFDDTKDGIAASFGRYHHVRSKSGPLPDPIVPLEKASFSVPGPEKIDGQKFGSLHCELYVPHSTEPGVHPHKLTLKSGDQTLELAVSVEVWNFTLADGLSFLPEMNCYGLPDNERDYYRLAHRHRTVLNKVPYHQSGSVDPGCAPKWDGSKLDWSAWDKRFGAYFDGTAFADLPRKGVPIDGFYLPLHENWPTPIEPNYNGNYWADRAFAPEYRRALVEVSKQFAEHFHAQGWNDTLFQFFLNGKNDYKRRGWSRGSSPWLLDEPSNFQDYWALRYFGAAFHEGVAAAPGKAKLVFRADISRPQWQRDALDGLLDYNVVGGAMREYPRMVADRKQAEGQIVIEYAGTNKIEDANMQAAGWCVDAWTRGADGVEPWQTVGTGNSWQNADELSLFYPARAADAGPIPSVRLKAYRRGQQDVEYLTLLSQLKQEPRWALGERVRQDLGLAGSKRGTGFTGGEDAGVIDFARLKPQDLWALRVRLGKVLSDAKPEPKRRLIEFRTPRRDPAKLEPRYVSGGE